MFDLFNASLRRQIFEVRQCFRHGKAHLVRCEFLERKYSRAHFVCSCSCADGVFHSSQTFGVMNAQFFKAFVEARDRWSVSRQCQRHIEFRQAVERCEKLRQRIAMRPSPQSNVGRDFDQHGITAEQEAFFGAVEHQMVVAVSRCRIGTNTRLPIINGSPAGRWVKATGVG